jgi:hypothetical protein
MARALRQILGAQDLEQLKVEVAAIDEQGFGHTAASILEINTWMTPAPQSMGRADERVCIFSRPTARASFIGDRLHRRRLLACLSTNLAAGVVAGTAKRHGRAA